MGRRIIVIVFGTIILAAAAFGQNFSGTFTLTSGTTKLTLVLNQGAAGQVTGSLTSSTGATFKLNGKLEEDIVIGTCQGQAGTSQFEASFEGALLIFTLMETGQSGEVTSRSLEFSRAGGGAGGSTSDALGLPPAAGGAAAAKPGGQAQPPAASRPSLPRPAPSAPAEPSAGGNVISVPELGVSFAVPPGWSGQKQAESVYLTSTNRKGFIVITRHAYNSFQEMAQEAGQGIVDASTNTRLMPMSQFQPFGKNGMVAEFSGTAQGQKARAFAIGLLSPQGGGVTIMAATEAASYSSDYSDAVLAVAGSLSFLAGGAQGGGAPMAGPQGGYGSGAGATDTSLMSYFAGEWYSYSSGSTIYGGAGTERKMTLCPDGNYRDSSEFSAGGTGQWGAANAQAGWGRWTIQGDRNQGTISVTYPNGQTRRIPYRVVSKEEQTISFDGVTYAFAGNPNCR
jgi:hypothetical protein